MVHALCLQKPDVLRAVLGCLPFRDLQMVLAYVVRQHAEALARVEEGGSNASGSGSVDGDEEDSECDEDDDECDDECDDDDEECEEDDEECEDDEDEEEEEFAGLSLFQVVVHDEGTFHQLIADCWNADDSDDAPAALPQGTQAAAQRGSPGGDGGQAGAGAASGKRGAVGGQAAAGSWLNLSSPQDRLNNGLLLAGATPMVPNEPYLEVADWWLEHLALKSKQEEMEAPEGQVRAAEGQMRRSLARIVTDIFAVVLLCCPSPEPWCCRAALALRQDRTAGGGRVHGAAAGAACRPRQGDRHPCEQWWQGVGC